MKVLYLTVYLIYLIVLQNSLKLAFHLSEFLVPHAYKSQKQVFPMTDLLAER